MKIPRKHGERFYSPLVRTIAEAEGISLEELETIPGTGLGGRVTKNDLLRYIQQRAGSPAQAPQPVAPALAPQQVEARVAQPTPQVITSPPPPQAPKPSWGPDVEVIPMDRVRQLIAEHMVRSKHTSPHVTSVAEADVTGIIRAHQLYRDEFQRREGIKLTLTPFFAKAIVDGVKQYPMVNVSVDGTNIIVHKNINLSFATLLPDGNLIVPVIKKAQLLNITDLAYMRIIPGSVVMAPKDEQELRDMLYSAIYAYTSGPVSLRYPRGNAVGVPLRPMQILPLGKGELLREGTHIALVAVGPVVYRALQAAELLHKHYGVNAAVVNARFVKPLDEELLCSIAQATQHVMTIEDGQIAGGFGSAVAELFAQRQIYSVRLKIHGIGDHFVEHGTQEELYRLLALDADGIAQTALDFLASAQATHIAPGNYSNRL